MKLFFRIFFLFAIALTAVEAMAQSSKERKKTTEALAADTTEVKETFVMPKNAPYFDSADDKVYHLRKVNIHGVKHINHDIIRSSSGLVPGDSIYLSG